MNTTKDEGFTTVYVDPDRCHWLKFVKINLESGVGLIKCHGTQH